MGERLQRLAASAPPLVPLLSFLASLVLVLLTGIWLVFSATADLQTQVALQSAETITLDKYVRAEFAAIQQRFSALDEAIKALPPDVVEHQLLMLDRQLNRLQNTIDAWHGPSADLP